MTTKPIPPTYIPVIDQVNGMMTRQWYEYFQSRDRMVTTDIRDVSSSAPTNGQVLVWNSTTKLYTPGAN